MSRTNLNEERVVSSRIRIQGSAVACLPALSKYARAARIHALVECEYHLGPGKKYRTSYGDDSYGRCCNPQNPFSTATSLPCKDY